MADNVTLPGTGEVVATDDISGVQYQRVKLTDGADGSTTHASVLASNADATTPGLAVRLTPQDTWSVSFTRVNGTDIDSPEMVKRRQGTGITLSQSNGNLVVGGGTTANAEFLARSTTSFNGALIERHQITASQRIANTNFAVLLADRIAEGASCTINSATSISVTVTAHGLTAANIGQSMFVGAINGANGVPGRYAIASLPDANTINFTVAGWPASGSCTVDLFGWNYIRWLYTGTTATQSAIDAQRYGWNSGDTTATISTTASPGHIGQTSVDGRNVYFADTLAASTTTPTVTTRASRYVNIPDDEIEMFLYLWCFNGTTNPASSTNWTVGFVSVEDVVNLPIYLAGVRPQGGAAPVPVAVQGTVTTTATSTNAASTNLIGDVGIQYRNSSTGAASGAHIVSAATTNATVVKASAGRVLGWSLSNNSASWRYVKLHNQTTAPTAGSGVVRTIAIPPGGLSNFTLEGGFAFSTGIGLTIVTGAADADATAVGANEVVGDLFFS